VRQVLIAAGLALPWAAGAAGQEGAAGQAPRPPSALVGADHPWDDGQRIDLTWELSPDDATLVSNYEVLRALAAIGPAPVRPEFSLVESVPAGTKEFTVAELTRELKLTQIRKTHAGDVDIAALEATGQERFPLGYLFRVVAVGRDGALSGAAQTPEPVTPHIQWYDGDRFWFMTTVIIFCGSVVLFIRMARTGRPLKVRKIAGLEAVDEAVGRATEMGRPCLFIPGIQDMNDIQTIAGINILSRVARTAARYDARVEVPTSRSLVMTTAKETVHAAYLEAGRPDAYDEDSIYYVTDEQFGYVAYLQGMMVRQKPAACFYMGSFFAESLILAETGNGIGAIQMAGTAQQAQLPFFVAACDYTLIGEEFFAASAYLTGSPEELGSLKGQDVGKLIVAAGIVAGVLGLTLAAVMGPDSELSRWLVEAVTEFQTKVLK
jgi:hypothetical protein